MDLVRATWRWVRGRQFRHAVVAVAGVIGLAFFVGLAIQPQPLFDAFVKGAIAAFVTMAVGSFGYRIRRGAQVDEMEAGGFRVKLARAARRPIRVLEERVDVQMRQINDRLYDLETRVFKACDGVRRESKE